jgi:hypothetical protein
VRVGWLVSYFSFFSPPFRIPFHGRSFIQSTLRWKTVNVAGDRVRARVLAAGRSGPD